MTDSHSRDVEPIELTLDPTDWDEVKATGHKVLEEMFDWLRTVRERPAWQPMPPEALAAFHQPLPRQGEGLTGAVDDFRSQVLPYPVGNVHPRFWAWVQGTGTPGGVIADMITAAFNVNSWGGQHAAPYVEAQVLRWLKELMGFPETASGVLVSGGSIANLVALQVARDHNAGVWASDAGLHALPQQLVFYASQEVHNSVDRAARTLGLGQAGLRKIAVDERFQVDCNTLRQTISQDRRAGLRPIGIIGTIGTVNTGAIDDLPRLAQICREENLWFHVDGAFGALAALNPALAHHVEGMALADSLAFDLHKWCYLPFNVGCTLVRRRDLHERSFFPEAASYLTPMERGTAACDINYSHFGPELSREFRALKVWMAFKEYGVDKLGKLIEQNVDQAARLGEAIQAEPELELMAPVSLNIVCFRYRVPEGSAADPDWVNREILMRIQELGIAVPSGTLIKGSFVIRVANTNHRSRRDDFRLLVSAVIDQGRRLTGPPASH